MKVRVALNVNGESREALVPIHKTLLEVLREDLGLTGTKHGCELGECGTCTVLVDGAAGAVVPGPSGRDRGCAVTTVEGMADGGRLHPLQQAFAELGAAQCGYCTPGISSRPRRSSPSGRARPDRRSRRRWPGTSVGAPATRRSSTPSSSRRCAWDARRPVHDQERVRGHRPAAAESRCLGESRR